jgi:hypothetical protein
MPETSNRQLEQPAIPRWVLPLLLGAFVLAGAIWLANAASSGEKTAPRWYGDQLSARGFSATPVGRSLPIVTQNSGDQRAPALAVVEQISIPSAQFPMLELALRDRALDHRIALVWRADGNPNVTQRLEISPGEEETVRVRLSGHSGWRGNIIGLGVAAGHPSGKPVSVDWIALRPDSAITRLSQLFEYIQMPWGRPFPGQESLSNTATVHPMIWLSAVVCGLMVGILWLLRSRFQFRSSAGLFLGLALALLVTTQFATQLNEDLGRSAVTSARSRVVLLQQLNNALLGDTQKASRVHIWSSDARGHEFALALAPRRATVRVGVQPLAGSDPLRTGDLVLVLSRRGVRYLPQTKSLEWDDGVSLQKQKAEIVFAQGGEVLFRVLA